jgi:hypothetical protein
MHKNVVCQSLFLVLTHISDLGLKIFLLCNMAPPGSLDSSHGYNDETCLAEGSFAHEMSASYASEGPMFPTLPSHNDEDILNCLSCDNEDLPVFRIIKVPKKDFADIVYSTKKRTVTDAAICKAKQMPTDIAAPEDLEGDTQATSFAGMTSGNSMFDHDPQFTDTPFLPPLFGDDQLCFDDDRSAFVMCVNCKRNTVEFNSDQCAQCSTLCSPVPDSDQQFLAPPPEHTVTTTFYESLLEAPLYPDCDAPQMSNNEQLSTLQSVLQTPDEDVSQDPVNKKPRRHTDAACLPYQDTPDQPLMPFPLSESTPLHEGIFVGSAPAFTTPFLDMSRLLDQILEPSVPFVFTPPRSRRVHNSPAMMRALTRTRKISSCCL